jgi:hypothetical protein
MKLKINWLLVTCMQVQMGCSQAAHLDLARANTRYAILKHDLET